MGEQVVERCISTNVNSKQAIPHTWRKKDDKDHIKLQTFIAYSFGNYIHTLAMMTTSSPTDQTLRGYS